MKYKLFAGAISILFLISIGASAISISDNNVNKQPLSMSDPVPTWSVGNSWTYNINDFKVDYENGNYKVRLNGKIDNFKWEVKSTSGTEYIVDISGKFSASLLDIYLPTSSSSVMHIQGIINPTFTTIDGNIVFTKSDLGIKDVTARIRGIAIVQIDPIPIYLPIPFKINLDTIFSTVLPTFDFPLSGHKFWNMPALDITADMEASGIFGLFKYPMTMTVSYSWIPLAFHCWPKGSITVAAGTFDAYEVTSLLFSLFEYHYAPTVGNIVKVDANMPNGEIHGELISYNYP